MLKKEENSLNKHIRSLVLIGRLLFYKDCVQVVVYLHSTI